jgi:pyocin large subunit-like protein
MGGGGGSSGDPSGNAKPTDRGFSEITREQHFDRHGHEYNAKTAKEYEDKARVFRDKALNENIKQFISRDGFLFKYDTTANDFLITKPNGEIVTFYKPTKGLSYWEGQVKIYDPNAQ